MSEEQMESSQTIILTGVSEVLGLWLWLQDHGLDQDAADVIVDAVSEDGPDELKRFKPGLDALRALQPVVKR